MLTVNCDMACGWLKLFCLVCLHSYVLCAYCNFDSKQANLITLYWQRPIKNYNFHLITPIPVNRMSPIYRERRSVDMVATILDHNNKELYKQGQQRQQ